MNKQCFTPEEILLGVMIRSMKDREEKAAMTQQILAAEPEVQFAQRAAISRELVEGIKQNTNNLYGELYDYANGGDLDIDKVQKAVEEIYVKIDALNATLSGLNKAHIERVEEMKKHMTLIREALGEK